MRGTFSYLYTGRFKVYHTSPTCIASSESYSCSRPNAMWETQPQGMRA